MATERDTSKYWWSNHHDQASNHLLELQKEIKEEEEEIFADINSLINGRSDLYSSFDDCEPEDRAKQQELQGEKDFLSTSTYIKPQQLTSLLPATTIASPTTITKTTTINNNIHPHIYRSTRHEQLFYSDDEEDEQQPLANDYRTNSQGANKITTTRDFRSNLGANDDDEASQDVDHFNIDSGPPPEEVDFMQQDSYPRERMLEHPHDLSSNHENDPNYDTDDHKFNLNSQQNYQTFQEVIQQVTSNLPKPCVFFLEGNCRRSDCKYSHDLSNITCKYWIEGFCFKGELCPFLHSYNPQIDPNDPDCLDEDGLRLLARKELNPTFAIESEADFPSLPLDAPASALNDSTKSSNNTDSLTSTIKDQILSSNPAVVFKTVKKKRKRG